MNVTLWIIAGFLAATFLASGLMKIAQPREKLVASGLRWAGDMSAGSVKGIGTVELLGAFGLILPAVLDVAPVLVPLAATGLALTMVGAAILHARRGNESQSIVMNAVLLILAAVVAWGRFGPYAF